MDEFVLKVWSWLKGGLLQGHVQFNMECDLVQYEKKVEIVVKSTRKIFWEKIISKEFKNHPKKTICK